MNDLTAFEIVICAASLLVAAWLAFGGANNEH